MYLLNAQQIRRAVDSNENYLTIRKFDEGMLQHTFYYFRMGAEYCVRTNGVNQMFELNGQSPTLTLKSHDYITVKTYETFTVGAKVMGILGQTTDLTRAGLKLVHSPFIDPCFNGRLQIGLYNLLKMDVKIRLRQRLGKIAFYDISDTYPITVHKDSLIGIKFQSMRPNRDDDPVPMEMELDDPGEY